MDKMRISILKDGTIKTVTDEISAANHQSAEDFLKRFDELTGGESTRERIGESQHHHHEEQQEHQHEGH